MLRRIEGQQRVARVHIHREVTCDPGTCIMHRPEFGEQWKGRWVGKRDTAGRSRAACDSKEVDKMCT